MAHFPEASKRLFDNVWICMRCNSKNRVAPGGKPTKCRKCKSSKLRLKRKLKKKA
ncbi:MAG: 50S ribosomal protein L40e [Candidatus Diapherotrites archaeon]|nr:50S ribosomal protein L40e [Candidatus Diapherotrites archaeon]